MFHLSWAATGDLAVEGESDVSSSCLLANVLDIIDWNADRVRLDLSGVEFIDHRSLLILEEHATREGRMVELIRLPRPVRRLLGLLEHDLCSLKVAS